MTKPVHLHAFANEPVTDFSRPTNREAIERALAAVHAQLGRDYDLLVAGRSEKTPDKLKSLNPSKPSEVVGIHSKATAALAKEAVEAAYAFFPEWSATPPQERADMLLRASALIRERKMEFDAWLVYEAGKTFPEADADVSEAIDFLEYYARQMIRLSKPDPLVQMPGERDEMHYLPLGVGIIVPPWNFPLAIMAGMTAAALVSGNTVVIKPSSDTPTIAAKFAEVLLAAGFPPKSFSMLVGSGAVVGDILVEHPKTRFVAFTGSKEVGLRINELAAKTQKGQVWIKRVLAEMGGKDAIVVDREADLESAVKGVLWSAFGYQGQKCSACSRAIVDQAIYDQFLDKLQAEVAKLTV
jgi:1-pyrroline-5-carboxylate dehydrogenase